MSDLSPLEAHNRTAATREPTVDRDGFIWVFNPASLDPPPSQIRWWRRCWVSRRR